MTGRKIRRAVRTTREPKFTQGRKLQKKRWLDINAPTSDFTPFLSMYNGQNQKAEPEKPTTK